MIKKAIFPVGGLGTRFLPATKALPKEMLPVVDKPLIQYAVEEAAAAGIEEFIFVTGRNKTAIEDHFDHSFELEETLFAKGKAAALETVRGMIHEPGTVAYVRQQEPAGLGHAVWCARHLIHDEPVAILLADDLILGSSCLAEMVASYQGGNMVALWMFQNQKPALMESSPPVLIMDSLSKYQGLLKNLIQQMPHQILVLLAAISLNQGFSPSLARKIAAPVTKCN